MPRRAALLLAVLPLLPVRDVYAANGDRPLVREGEIHGNDVSDVHRRGTEGKDTTLHGADENGAREHTGPLQAGLDTAGNELPHKSNRKTKTYTDTSDSDTTGPLQGLALSLRSGLSSMTLGVVRSVENALHSEDLGEKAKAVAAIEHEAPAIAASGDSELQTGLADAARMLGRPDLALRFAGAAVQGAPRSADAHRAYAAAALASGDAAGAIAAARAALALDPGDERARGILRMAESRQGLQQGSERALAKTKAGALGAAAQGEREGSGGGASAPRDPRAGAGTGAGAGAGPAAAPAASTATRQLLQQALSRKAVGDLAGALQSVDRALAAQPGSCDALNLRAAILNQLGRHREAEASADSSMRLCGENVPALDARAMALNRLGEFRRGFAAGDRSVALAPRSPFGYLNRAESEGGLKDLRAMVADLKRAASLDPRFYPRYRAEAQSNGFVAEPPSMLTDAAMFGPAAGAGPEPAAAQGLRGGAGAPRRLLVWVLATLVGGFLIAAGLLHASARRTTRMRRAPAGAPEGATSAPVRAAAPDGVRLQAPIVLRKPIGRGGMGIVYDAWDTSLERRVAVKKLREELGADPRERARFVQEARLVAALEHPAIVAIHTVFEEAGELYLVFEFVDGTTLDALLRERGRLPLEEAARLLRPVCEALDYAHARKVVHRDLKPANVMVARSGAVKVMDFGIARQAKDSLTRLSATQTIAGTPLYMPPEADQGLVGRAGDVYSLGVMAYELLTGATPYPPPGSALQKASRSYPRLSSADAAAGAGADAAIHAALDPDPSRRPEGALRFWEAFSGRATPSATSLS